MALAGKLDLWKALSKYKYLVSHLQWIQVAQFRPGSLRSRICQTTNSNPHMSTQYKSVLVYGFQAEVRQVYTPVTRYDEVSGTPYLKGVPDYKEILINDHHLIKEEDLYHLSKNILPESGGARVLRLPDTRTFVGVVLGDILLGNQVSVDLDFKKSEQHQQACTYVDQLGEKTGSKPSLILIGHAW